MGYLLLLGCCVWFLSGCLDWICLYAMGLGENCWSTRAKLCGRFQTMNKATSNRKLQNQLVYVRSCMSGDLAMTESVVTGAYQSSHFGNILQEMSAFSCPVDWSYSADCQTLSLLIHVLCLGNTDTVYVRYPHGLA